MNEAPWPLLAGELDRTLESLESGTEFREAFEALLLTLPLERAQPLMLLHREGRAGWMPLTESCGGNALCVGNAFSGSWVALARAGFRPTLVDTSLERLRFARLRMRAAADVEARCLLAEPGRALPLRDESFELAVVEPALEPARSALAPHELSRLAHEVVLVADNRFAYKRSDGHRGRFALAGPRALARSLFAPRAGERTLAGHRRTLEPGAGSTRAFALYPHAQDWTHAVALDSELPALRIGSKERRNRLKTIAHRAGLFPLLSPSFALFRGPGGPTRVDRILAALADRLGETRLELEELVSTKGNNVLLFARRAQDEDPEGRARFVVHLPLSLHQRRLAERHAQALRYLARSFPRLPVPELVFEGELTGVSLVCERRLGGLPGTELSGDSARVAHTLTDLARALETLVVVPPAPLTAEAFGELVSSKFDLVIRRCGVPATRAQLVRMRDASRERLVGRPLPRVFAHADLRSKHVQVGTQGELEGLLDWGSHDPLGLPTFDLSHFLLHEWKQAGATGSGAAWRRLLAAEPRDEPARELLRTHARNLGVDADVQAALEAIHPVLVGATAESSWDYSRPRWLQRAYGLGAERAR